MKQIKNLLLIVILTAFIYIVVTDVGDSRSHSSGAGDIWWTDTADIEQAYRSITERK